MVVKAESKNILYTAPGCPFCVIAKKYLEKNNIKFKEVDVSQDENAKKEMEYKSKQSSIPVIDAGGEIIIGYDLKKIKEVFGIK